MRLGPDDESLSGPVTWIPLIASQLGDQFLAGSIPVISGTFTYDVTQQVPERLTFTVPEEADGFSWIPDTFDHPLAKYGQQVALQIEVTSPNGGDWIVSVATLQIQDWEHDDVAKTVTVEALGLLQIAADDSFITPEAPRTTDTFTTAFTRLLPDGLGVNFDPALVDRPLPQSFQWDQDRLGALYDIADAWPARMRVDEFGTVQMLPPLGAIPAATVMTFTQGVNGTLISAPASDTRDQVYNVVVCTSSSTDDPARAPVQAVAQVQNGPLDPTGNYGYVVRYYSSPLVTTAAQCQSAAASILQQSLLPAFSKVATIAPDPRPEVDDPVQVIQYRDGETVLTLGWITGYTMPLTLNDGPMPVTVGSAIFS